MFSPAVIVLLRNGAYWTIQPCNKYVSGTVPLVTSQPLYCSICRLEIILSKAIFCLISNGGVEFSKIDLRPGLENTSKSSPFADVPSEPCGTLVLHDFQGLCRKPWTVLWFLRRNNWCCRRENRWTVAAHASSGSSGRLLSALNAFETTTLYLYASDASWTSLSVSNRGVDDLLALANGNKAVSATTNRWSVLAGASAPR